MGCRHSKTNDVVEKTIVPPPNEGGKTSVDTVFTEMIADEMSKSDPSVEEHNNNPIVEHEQEVAITSPIAAQAQEAPATKENPQPSVVVSVQKAPEDRNETLVAIVQVEEDPILVVEEEKVALVESATKADNHEVVPQKEESPIVREKSVVTSVSAPPTVWTFVAETISFTVGVAYYNISGSNTKGEEVLLTKRYSEFKVLHAEMTKFMTSNELPRLPGASFLQGRNDKTLLRTRETAFVKMLNAIAQHPDGSVSAPFTAFLT